MPEQSKETWNAIRKNILNQICYVRFGSSSDEVKRRFRGELYQFLRNSDEKPIARQAIGHWFRSGQGQKYPLRSNAIEFLLKYMKSNIKSSELDDERADLYNQIIERGRNTAGLTSNYEQIPAASNRIAINDRGNLTIRVGPDNILKTKKFRKIEGCYFAYHSRLTQDHKGEFTQEVLKIDRIRGGLRFKLWYLRDGVRVSRYDGSIFIFGNMIWFIGYTGSPDRLRAMNFRNIESQNDRYYDFYCGLMLSDLPAPTDHDPVSCRVVLLRMDNEPANIEKFADENVKNFTKGQILTGRKKEIFLLIDNKVTALTSPLTLTAVRDEVGRDIRDNVLKVNKDTINRMCDYIYGVD